jgi:hypothetical protein
VNPCGLFGFSGPNEKDEFCIVTPYYSEGSVQVKWFNVRTFKEIFLKSTIFKVAENAVVALDVNKKGTLLATASSKGTLIRLWDLK